MVTNTSHVCHKLMFAACMKTLIGMCVPGAKVLDICECGDKYMTEETAKVFKKEKEMKKGI